MKRRAVIVASQLAGRGVQSPSTFQKLLFFHRLATVRRTEMYTLATVRRKMVRKMY